MAQIPVTEKEIAKASSLSENHKIEVSPDGYYRFMWRVAELAKDQSRDIEPAVLAGELIDGWVEQLETEGAWVGGFTKDFGTNVLGLKNGLVTSSIEVRTDKRGKLEEAAERIRGEVKNIGPYSWKDLAANIIDRWVILKDRDGSREFDRNVEACVQERLEELKKAPTGGAEGKASMDAALENNEAATEPSELQTAFSSAAIGSMLKDMRVNAGLRQADIAERTGKSEAAIRYVEKGGGGNLSVETINEYAQAVSGANLFELHLVKQ